MSEKDLIAKVHETLIRNRKELAAIDLDITKRSLPELDKAIKCFDAPIVTGEDSTSNRYQTILNKLLDEAGGWIHSTTNLLDETRENNQKLKENDYENYIKENNKIQQTEKILFNIASVLKDYCLEETERNNIQAKFFIGVLYYFGICVEQDDTKAITYLESAALKNHTYAQEALAQIYYWKNEIGKSLIWIKRLAEEGIAECQTALGSCYIEGIGVAVNEKEAFQWFRKAAEQGDCDAQNMLGRCYEEGWGTTKDDIKAFTLYKKAAEQGNDAAQNNLGKCYHDGIGTVIDYTKAFEWLEKAANQGNVHAQYHLGYYYTFGQGIEENYEKGFQWMKKAAEQDNAEAQFNIAYCYLNGWGTEQDLHKAFFSFKEIAERGFAEAQFMVGECYLEGYGTEIDVSQAMDWYKKAAKQGNEKAKNKIDELENSCDKTSDKPKYLKIDYFFKWLYKQTVALKTLDFENDGHFLYWELELFLGDCIYSFERQWNAFLEEGYIHENIYTEFVLLGMMHQVLEEQNIQHKPFEEYFFTEEKQPAILIIDEFLKADKDILFSNKAFAALAPMALGGINEHNTINPLFVFLIPCYETAYYFGRKRILDFKEEDYPGVEFNYKFYKPDKGMNEKNSAAYGYFNFLINQFLNSATIYDFADHIEKALAKLLDYKEPIYRKTKIKDKEEYESFLKEYEVGNVVENLGFWSATKQFEPYDASLITNSKEAEVQLIYVKIIGFSGKEALYGEIIIPRRRQFLVTARQTGDLNVTKIILQEIDPI